MDYVFTVYLIVITSVLSAFSRGITQNKTIQKNLLKKNCPYELSVMAFKDIVAWPNEVIKLSCLLKKKHLANIKLS